MKTKTFFILNRSVLIILFLAFFISCRDLNPIDGISGSEISDNGVPWYELIDQFNLAPGIIVSNGSSIQEAIDVADPGDVIYIEAGVYRESISLNKSVKLVGLNEDLSGSVVLENPREMEMLDISNGAELSNIQLMNYEISTSELKSGKKDKNAQNQKFITMTRSELRDNVAYYKFDVRLGHGKYERITLHRLVRENVPYRPAKTKGNIFMVHGANQNFRDIYLEVGAIDVTPKTSIAMYLASNGIDVWGIDLGWTRVPEEETDFSFMKDWGIDREVDDILKGMAVARLIRGITKQGFERMNLLGFSYSIGLVYVAASRETQEHRVKRDIEGIIPVDGDLIYDPQDNVAVDLCCANAQNSKTNLDNGIYSSKSETSIFGQLAAASPDDPSPIFPGLTNFQAALFLGASTYELGGFPNSYWHFVAGVYDNGIPVDLAYTSTERWIQLLAQIHAGPYMPEKAAYEYSTCECNAENSTLDDHLGDIYIPVLYMGSGGVGTQGYYTVDQLGSQDVTKHLVSLNADPTLDFGHGDLFLADNA
ncbi:hypothetical protein N9164_16170, partial [Draconibacterium sp.]|nr:hypothetical protein [Draconibacterium sp.]